MIAIVLAKMQHSEVPGLMRSQSGLPFSSCIRTDAVFQTDNSTKLAPAKFRRASQLAQKRLINPIDRAVLTLHPFIDFSAR